MASRRLVTSQFYATFYRWNTLTHCGVHPRHASPNCQNDLYRSLTSRGGARFLVGQSFRSKNQPEEDVEEGSKEPYDRSHEHKRAISDDHVLESKRTAEASTVKQTATVQSTLKTNISNEEASLNHTMRVLMRQVAYPVVVVTAGHRNLNSETATHQAMTVSSFNTLTLDPDPIITFNVRTPSRTLDAIHAGRGRFLVHIPTNSSEGAFIAHAFTQGNAQRGFQAVQEGEAEQKHAQVTFLHHSPGVELPLMESEHILATLACEVLKDKMVQAGDHVIVIAKVTQVNHQIRMFDRRLDKNKRPFALQYWNQAYSAPHKNGLSGVKIPSPDSEPKGQQTFEKTPPESKRDLSAK